MYTPFSRQLAALMVLLTGLAAAAPLHAWRPPPTVSGLVTDSSGEALAGVRVRIAELDRLTTTGPDGRFTFVNVPPGRYSIAFESIGHTPQVLRITVGPTDAVITTALRPSVIELPGVQVTATAGATSALASPQPTSVVSGAELRQDQAPSLGETLRDVPGVHSLSTGVGIGKPVIRGLASNRVLVLDDGQRLETQQWGDEHGPNVETADAERIEVIRGPASVLYGSDALGGVVNVIPRPLPDALGREPFARGRFEGAYGTNNRGREGTVELEGATGPLGAGASLTARESDDVRTPDYLLWNSGNRALGGGGTVGYRGSAFTLIGTYAHRDERIELTDEEPDATPFQRIGEDRGRLDLTLPLGMSRLEVSGAVERNRRREFKATDVPAVALGLRSLAYQGHLHYHHAPVGRFSGVLGVDGGATRFRKFGEETLIPNTNAVNAGLFGFEQADLGRWSVSLGGRFDYRHLDVHDDAELGVLAQTRTYSSLTGNLGLLFRVSRPFAIVLNVGRGYRAPTSFDLFSNGVHEGTAAFERGNPDLRNETSINTDLALRVVESSLVAEVGGFVNAINDYIYTVPTGQTDPESGFEIYDVAQGDARLAGFEASVEYHPASWLHLRAAADHVLGRNVATDEPLPAIPPFRVNYSARVEGATLGPAHAWFVELGGTTSTRQTRLDPAEALFFADAFDGAGYQPRGYTLAHAGAGAALNTGGRTTHVELRLDNVFNAAYADFLSRLKTNAVDPGQGRNLSIRVSTEF